MSRFNHKKAALKRNESPNTRSYPIPTATLDSKLSAERCYRTDKFSLKLVMNGNIAETKAVWAPYQFVQRSQQKKRILARRSASF